MNNTYSNIYVGDTAPKSRDAVWLSTALRHARVADGPAERAICITPDQSYENNSAQEPSVWYLNGKWHMLYTAGPSGPIAYAYNSSPDPRKGAWTKTGLVFSPGGGSLHAYAYIDGDVGYWYYPNSALSSLSVVTFDARDPTAAWGTPSVLMASVPWNVTLFGNPAVTKIGDEYVLMLEVSVVNKSWQMSVYKSASPTGPFALVSNILPTLWPQSITGDNPTASGAFMTFENSEYVLMYHAGRNIGEALPTEIYRATSPDLVNWVIDFSGYPMITRQLPQECDQVADFHAAKGPNGAWWAFWSANNNHPSINGYVICAPMQASLMAHDGEAWDYLLAIPNSVQEPGFIRHSAKTAAYTLANRDEVVFDTNGASRAATLPPASIGTYVRIANISTGATLTNTVTLVAAGSDVLLGPSATALSVGECHEYHCLRTGYWTRM